ncbi:hypothetical protein RRG08_016314 [Elysia crispata]|uniref:Uncharacterized protein n=1 Tax=Elysia crispata TaxID=231223 RepID=A0AAE1E5W2_9GAST|nr:hypothetical protein RRG08_016314 [Elysia crispata]
MAASARCRSDRLPAYIEDVLLLSNRIILVADRSNSSVKLFTMQGDHLDSESLRGRPVRLAVIVSGPGNIWKVAVTFLMDQRIDILEVTPESVTKLTSVQTSCKSYAVTAVDTATLAVGYIDDERIDLIDVTGRVLCQLSQTLDPWYMTLTQDGCLLMSSNNGKVSKVTIQEGYVVFHRSVPQIKNPAGVATLQDGWFVVSDWKTTSLHLVTPDGHWDRQLWRHPRGSDCGDLLWSVSV